MPEDGAENNDPVEQQPEGEVPVENKDEAAGGEPEEKKSLLAVPKIPSPFDEPPYVPSEVTDPDMHNLSPCCCCMCACSHDRVGEATCFGCLPIKCGVMFIAIQIFFLSVILITVTFFQLLNEYLPWWFVFITLLLLVPSAIAASTMVYFFAKDKRGTRVGMFSAIILSIISISLWAVWNVIFFLAIYKKDTVYTGMGAAADEENYHATPKRTYLFTVLAEATFILVWLTYYTCVANQYCNLMNAEHDRRADEKKAQEKADEEAAAEAKKQAAK